MSARTKTIILVLFLTILCLSLFKIWITYQLTQYDTVYPVVTTQLHEAQRENMDLEDELLRDESLMSIKSKAGDRGFTVTPPVVWLIERVPGQ